MATFTVTGTVRREPAEVTWTDGAITGDELAVDVVQVLVEFPALDVSLPGLWNGEPTLEHHLGALATVLYCFDQGAVIEGDDPDVEDIPGDAIA